MKQIFQTDEETSLFINFLNKIKGRIMKNDINEGGLENISNEFEALGFTKVKDLAQKTFEKASSIKLSGNSSTLLYKSLEMYDGHL
ncbi:UDP-N-acetylglucosamine--peptide N-acetylglucosaminyltransferase 110 kDa subunit-like, partial [Aphis craccivora]